MKGKVKNKKGVEEGKEMRGGEKKKSEKGEKEGDFPQFAPLATGAPSKKRRWVFGGLLRGVFFSTCLV